MSPRAATVGAAGVGPASVLRYRARATHLDRKLPAGPGSLAEAAWGGLQDSVPRSGVISLHARVVGVGPGDWEDPALVQIWFRGGADYLVPRSDVGVFTLGCYPRDQAKARRLEVIADEVHRVSGGRMTPVRDLPRDLGGRPFALRQASITGRVHIRWDASNIWVLPVERPAMDPEEARRELLRRFLLVHAPATVRRFAQWAGVEPADGAESWRSIETDLVPVDIDGLAERRFALASDIDAIRDAEPLEGVRLLPMDDPFTKYDHELLLPDDTLRARTLPKVGRSPGYIPGAVLVDGEIVGAWQRQQRKVTIHPFRSMPARLRDEIEAEGLSFPITGPGPASVTWAPV